MTTQISNRKNPRIRVRVGIYRRKQRDYPDIPGGSIIVEVTNGKTPRSVGREILSAIGEYLERQV